MRTAYVAYGLQLSSSFVLSGMTPREADDGSASISSELAPGPHGLASISLEQTSDEELDSRWSGSCGQVEWRGTLGDGCHLTIERGMDGDVLFTYADRARFRLDPTRTALDCAPSEDGLSWQQVLLGRILPNVALERGCEALHASAVESPNGVVAICAPSGMGKTTLAVELLKRGWPLFADDVLTLTLETDGVRAHPGTPLMNIGLDYARTLDIDALGTPVATLSQEHWLAATNAATSKLRVRMICLLERRSGLPLEARRLPSSPLPLAPYMLGLADDHERERKRFSLYADLMGAAELLKLTCDIHHRASDVAELIERELSLTPMLVSA
jgi:hypothetical protein